MRSTRPLFAFGVLLLIGACAFPDVDQVIAEDPSFASLAQSLASHDHYQPTKMEMDSVKESDVMIITESAGLTPNLSTENPVAEMEAMQVVRSKLCNTNQQCSYTINISSKSENEDNKHAEMNEDQAMELTFDLHVNPGTVQSGGQTTYILTASNYKTTENDKDGQTADLTSDDATFERCLLACRLEVVQEDATGSMQFMLKHTDSNIPDDDTTCAEDATKIYNMLVGSTNTISNAEKAATTQEAGHQSSGQETTELIEFRHVQPDTNGKRTTHYRREMHDNGSVTIHRTHTYELEQLRQSTPAGKDSVSLVGQGSSTVGSDGTVQKATETNTNVIGKDSPKTGFSCTGNGEIDANGKSCDTSEVNTQQPEKARMEVDVIFMATLLSNEEMLVEDRESFEEFIERHAKEDRKPVPAHQAIMHDLEQEILEPENVEEGMVKFLQYLETAPNSEFQQTSVRRELEKTMTSSEIRQRTVSKLAKNQLKNGRAVQAVMHAIGRVAMKQPHAVTQLIELASDPDVPIPAQQQALVALLQARCWDHKHAIDSLRQLVDEPKSEIQFFALHVQHGLIAHSEHCAHGAYGNAKEYRELLQKAHVGLSEAVENNEDQAAVMWLTAIGNSNSQHPEDTAAVAAIANDDKLSAPVRRAAIHTLGKLWTASARTDLGKLADDSTDGFIQGQAAKALAGEHLVAGDPRRPEEMPTLTQTSESMQGGSVGIKREKVWPQPSTGDLRAEPKVGVEIYKNNYDKYCLHGYAGVDGKAWTWTVSLIQAGGEKCVGSSFDKYISVLGIRVWPSGRGGTHPNAAQLSQAGDQQGKCNMNVDAADFVVTIAFDWTFFEFDKTFVVGGVPINGNVRLEGEIGLKTGWGNLGNPNVQPPAGYGQACQSGTTVFAIPYAQATLTGELSLDLAAVKGGVGISVLLVKFSLPATTEEMTGVNCGGTYFKAEAMGGNIYAFLSRIESIQVRVRGCCWWQFWKWQAERVWQEVARITIYEWSSPQGATFTSSELTCRTPAGGHVVVHSLPKSRRRAPGSVQAQYGATVTAGVAFVPDVRFNHRWYPICGHFFWNNNAGATTVCQGFGFSSGTCQRAGNTYSIDSMPVGSCRPGQALNSCNDGQWGGNAWGNFEYGGGFCKGGYGPGVTVTCN